MPIVAILGSKHSGKTTAAEALVQGLTKRGYSVAAVKHVPKPDFTIDTKGKDTWKYAKAGAQTVISVAPNEIATIRSMDTTKLDLEELLQDVEDEVDIVILEGFKKLVGENPAVTKIVAIKATEEALEASRNYKPILAFVGPVSSEAAGLRIPCIDMHREPDRLVDMVEKRLSPLVKKRRETGVELRVKVNKKGLSLNPFVQKIIRETTLAMVSNLKGAKVVGNENVSITVESVSERD